MKSTSTNQNQLAGSATPATPVIAGFAGEPLHTRAIDIELRSDATAPADVIVARARILDLRKQGFIPMIDDLQTAGLIHDMRIDARIDAHTRVLLEVSSAQPHVVVEPTAKSLGESCRDPAANLEQTVGHPYDDDMRKRLGDAMGGPRGCSHLLTLAHALAQSLPRALDAAGDLSERLPGERIYKRSLFLDGSLGPAGELIEGIQLHDFHFAAVGDADIGVDRLARHDEVKVLAAIDLATRKVASLGVSERQRSGAALGDDAWTDRSAEVAFALGATILPGLGGLLMKTLGDRSDASLMLEALLHLAPGFVQCPAAMADRFLGRDSDGADRSAAFAGGGMTNSCYVWREGGKLVQRREIMAAKVRGD